MSTGLVVHLFVKLSVFSFDRSLYVERKHVLHLSVPDFLTAVLCVQSVKNAITAQQDEVMRVVLNFYVVDLWLCNYDIRVALIFLHFGLSISEGSRN